VSTWSRATGSYADKLHKPNPTSRPLGVVSQDFQRVSARFRSNRSSFSHNGVVTCNSGIIIPL
jgi:hypothetical protein